MTDTVSDRFEKLKEKAASERAGLKGGAEVLITVGTATCGRSAGALETLAAIKAAVKENSINARVMEVGCHGHCYAEPLVSISKPGWPEIYYGNITEGLAPFLIKNFLVNEDPALEWALGAVKENEIVPSVYYSPRFGGELRRLLARCGRIDPENIFHYIAEDGYSGLVKALKSSQMAAIDEIKKSGLRGLGGAGFPTWRKWAAVRAAAAEKKFVICNADEGDPGAFMDRTLIESDPFALIEGMTIAGYAVGAAKGFIYVRNEYPLAVERISAAVTSAKREGLLGTNILGSGLDFDIEVVQGAGAFVCGEETALINSLEGRRGTPRLRPAFPAERGYKGCPTLVNNVKTLSYVYWIMARGAEEFASVGTKDSKGTAVFALAGKTRNPGLVEVPMGTTLREIIFEIGGGIPPVIKPSQLPGEKPVMKARAFKAVQIGGPSGGCLPESLLDTPVDFDSLREAGAIMGSGGMVVMDEDNCMVAAAEYFLDFTMKESCGKCVFCRVGVKHMLDILSRITRGEGSEEDLATLEELADKVKRGSLCNLGKTAPNPVLTTLRYFRNEYEAHIEEKVCPACECEALIAYYIDLEKCRRACDACVGSCPTEAIYTRSDRLKAIAQEKCVKCHSCLEACPASYDAVFLVSPANAIPEQKPDKKSDGARAGGGPEKRKE
ncbi:MAG: NADP-reducing hydrogenase subunit HndC [bacterium ADurb.Bin236]|nr:MAG: NADP-reducing hydrogenase subunit HndC [bacterium ADurb.Bin236]HOY64108.1 NADH-ubiquinone oxidoreductase-F iron-sulfur binding region domain-containing protein [bacterium]HPN93941.1 NADH-ubiquinone oxidoreductase-F iron-sulfur binding region domain-containing protein [bacterium]